MSIRQLSNDSKTLSVENIQFQLLAVAKIWSILLEKEKWRGDKNFYGNFVPMIKEGFFKSLNAAYSNNCLRSPRSSTLGRPLSAAHGTSPHRKKKFSSFMSSSPNLSVMASTSSSTGRKKEINRGSPKTGSTLPVNGDEKPTRNSGGDYILQMQQENETLRRELDLKESKLQANMNSIKTFWSPELKKERALRKEELSRMVAVREQLKVAQEENQHAQLTMQALQDELRAQRDLNQLLQDDFASAHRQDGGTGIPTLSSADGDVRSLEENNDRLLRENELLQQTMEEMEARIEVQQQTLDTRDESVRKLLEMLQCKGLSRSEDAEAGASVEVDALKVQLSGYESKLARMEQLLQDKNKELLLCKQNRPAGNDVFEESANLKAIQSLLDVKETKIVSLERIIRDLEDEVTAVRHDEALASAERKEESKQLEAYKSHSNYMKSKIEQLKSDLQKRETDILSLQTKLDTMNNQQSDSRQHIDVLKESILAKEQSSAILQSEVESLRIRLDEKQQLLDQKQEQLGRFQEDKRGNDSELNHLRDTMDVKDRKITVLMKKIENLKEGLSEREREITSTKSRLSALQHDSSAFTCNMSTMEEALEKKNEELKIVKSEKEILEEKLQNDVDELRKIKKTLEKKLEAVETELRDREANFDDVQEKASSLASSVLKKDTKIKQLEISLEEKIDELSRVDIQLKKIQNSNILAKTQEENREKVEKLEKIAKEKTEEAEKWQKELDRHLEILKETENEKHSKDKKIISLEKETKDLNLKIKSLNAQMVEELKRKGAAQDKDIANYLEQLRRSRSRVEELEVALKESLNITAEREEYLSREQDKRHKLEKQMEELIVQFQKTKTLLEEQGKRFASCEASLHEKDRRINFLKKEKRKLLENALEMKQDALLAEISEKDANIALLEISQSRQKSNADEVFQLRRQKDNLVQELKQQTQNRLKLLQDSDDSGNSSGTTGGQNEKPARPRPATADDDGEGIWA